jgi:hypothetical protein
MIIKLTKRVHNYFEFFKNQYNELLKLGGKSRNEIVTNNNRTNQEDYDLNEIIE